MKKYILKYVMSLYNLPLFKIYENINGKLNVISSYLKNWF